MGISVSIAVEDSLSEKVIRKLIHHTHRDWTVGGRYPPRALAGGHANKRNRKERRGLSGWGQIRANLPAYNNAAKKRPFIVLTDLDVHVQCPGDLWAKWMPHSVRNPNLLFRVAVKEVEAWLLADRINMADFLAVPKSNLPVDAEKLADPKDEIVNLARQSGSEDIRSALVPAAGSSASVGRAFERKMLQFVSHDWDIAAAAKHCRSLERAIAALTQCKFKP